MTDNIKHGDEIINPRTMEKFVYSMAYAGPAAAAQETLS